MRGDNHLLALTTSTDEITNEVKPLFGFPVQVVKATEDPTPSWANATPSGAKTDGLERIDPATGEVFGSDAVRKGVRMDGEFREIAKENIEAIDEATKIKTMVALGKLPLAEAWAQYGDRVTGKYFLQSPAQNGSPTAYKLTMESLREVRKGKKVERPATAIVTKRTSRSRQSLGIIYTDESAGPDGEGCLVMLKVEFGANMRQPDAQILAPASAQVDESQLAMAREVIDNMPDGRTVLDGEVDEAIALRAELVEQAIAGKGVVAPTKKVAEAVEQDNLKAALEASLAAA